MAPPRSATADRGQRLDAGEAPRIRDDPGDRTRGRCQRRGQERPAALALATLEVRSEEHTSELQSQSNLVCRLLLEKKKKKNSLLSITKKKTKKIKYPY